MVDVNKLSGNGEKLEALAQTADRLVAGINELNTGTGRKILGLDTQVRRNRKALWLVLGSLVVDVIVTVVLAFTIHSTQNNTDQLNTITARLDYSQNVSRKQALCPLFKIFVDSKSDVGRKTYPKGPAEYDRLFGIIEGSYNTLQCDKAKLQPIPK